MKRSLLANAYDTPKGLLIPLPPCSVKSSVAAVPPSQPAGHSVVMINPNNNSVGTILKLIAVSESPCTWLWIMDSMGMVAIAAANRECPTPLLEMLTADECSHEEDRLTKGREIAGKQHNVAVLCGTQQCSVQSLMQVGRRARWKIGLVCAKQKFRDEKLQSDVFDSLVLL